MSAHCKFPQFAGISPHRLAALLERSNLSIADRQIAILRLCYQMTYADIGAALGTEDKPLYMDRSTVGRRMNTIIAPRLEQLMKQEEMNESI